MTDAFFDAVARGDTERVRALLDADQRLVHALAGSDDAHQGGPDARALHVAVRYGHADIARLLVDRGADPGARNGEGRTALHVALECNDSTCDLLRELGCPVDVCAAAAMQDLDRLDALLADDRSLVHDMTTGLCPLGWAAYFGADASVRRLLAAGADPSFDRPLFCAAQVAALGVAKLLVEAGADPAEVHEEVGGNVLHMAALMRFTRDARPFVRWLLDDCGVDPREPGPGGHTARALAEREAARQAAAEAAGRRVRPRPYAELAELLRRAEERR